MSRDGAAEDSARDAAVEDIDGVLAGRAASAGEYLAGLLAAAELDTAGTVRKLPADSWPDVDAAAVQEIWDRACAVAWRASQFAGSPWLHRDRLEELRGLLEEAGFVAMGRQVAGARGLVARPVHPADWETGREH